ncbi:hypothetical protein IC614_08150 [Allosphingosinicella flava]|uniref:DUF1236 domain-containing protein n=1 Tax=Allosphingosinicella flava TaxID=2771430 RepID=A0A7T2GI62_9SPHN|nr:hypothetical protein [Sphingosinicella flava]QPQ54327.1 hypothetical protein IC614_08150 [Sphingosinicella flava]
MRNMLIAASALALIGAGPALAQGHGKGGGHSQSKDQSGKPGKGQGNGKGHGNGHAARGNGGGAARDRGPVIVQARHDGRNDNRGAAKREDRRARAEIKQARAMEARAERGDRVKRVVRAERRPVEVAVLRDTDRIRTVRTGLIDGCPPGLAKKNNGCLPPGQAKQLAERRAYYSDWWRYGRDGNDDLYRYDDGYLYRIDPRSYAVSGFLPVLGGALGVGNVWPAGYTAYPAPDYYVDYYGYGDSPYDYRYADGALYGVDPSTNAITQIAALLTGNDWTVGQAMPAGYSVYNVPYAYRSQYYDTPEAMYRYDDGYIYRVDPTTQLIQAAIQLIT